MTTASSAALLKVADMAKSAAAIAVAPRPSTRERPGFRKPVCVLMDGMAFLLLHRGRNVVHGLNPAT
jgi:hypothetical protein